MIYYSDDVVGKSAAPDDNKYYQVKETTLDVAKFCPCELPQSDIKCPSRCHSARLEVSNVNLDQLNLPQKKVYSIKVKPLFQKKQYYY